jgi:hypothetical protein
MQSEVAKGLAGKGPTAHAGAKRPREWNNERDMDFGKRPKY